MLGAKKVSDSLVVICESHDDKSIVFCMQLVIGTSKAALIDAGNQKDPGLLKLLRRFTALPIALYLTHGHRDHVGNASYFDEIHIGMADCGMLEEGLKLIPLSHGEKIDLGGTVLEAYALSGHTDGAFCFINKNDGYALTGDIINRETWLCWDSCDMPEQYAKKVSAFYDKLRKYGVETIFEGHGCEPLTSDICKDMICALNQIDAETDKMHHMECSGIKNLHSYGKSTIIYDKEIIKNGKRIQNHA